MAKFQTEWLKLEGPVIKDPGSQYGTLDKIPTDIVSRIFFTPPEIQIEDPSNYNGAVYRILYIEDYWGYNSVNAINTYWNTLNNAVNSFDKTIEWTQTYTAIYNHQPFTLNKSAVIFYADSTNNGQHREFDHIAWVLIDETVKPKTSNIFAEYRGPAIEVGGQIDKDDIAVTAKFEDGNETKIASGAFVVEPMDLTVVTEGQNVFTIKYIDPEGDTNETIITVQGKKRLTGINAYYDPDGPRVAMDHEAEAKYFVVIANYSDGTSATVAGFEFPDGNIVSETNDGNIRVYYKGFEEIVNVPTYTVDTARLIVYYNGPDVEIGHEYLTRYVNVKVYYESDNEFADSYYEDIDVLQCTFDKATVSDEGANEIKCTYESEVGTIYAYFIVTGIKPGRRPTGLEAEYIGPEIIVGKTYNPQRVKVKCHFSDRTIETITNFGVSSNIVSEEGPNTFTAYYIYETYTVETTFAIIGIAPEDTTETGYMPIDMDNNYPYAQRINNRYRGPAESMKHNAMSLMLMDNIKRIYQIFSNIETDFNKAVDTINANSAARTITIGQVQGMNDTIKEWKEKEEYKKVKYINTIEE